MEYSFKWLSSGSLEGSIQRVSWNKRRWQDMIEAVEEIDNINWRRCSKRWKESNLKKIGEGRNLQHFKVIHISVAWTFISQSANRIVVRDYSKDIFWCNYFLLKNKVLLNWFCRIIWSFFSNNARNFACDNWRILMLIAKKIPQTIVCKILLIFSFNLFSSQLLSRHFNAFKFSC